MATHSYFAIVLLLGVALLPGASGCTPHEAPPAGTGSYQLDGRPITCQATASLFTGAKASDALYVDLTTIPQPAGGPETFTLVFRKIKGHPDTDYTHEDAYYTSNSQTLSQGVRYVSPQATIAPTASGGFSGTFSASLGSGAAGTIQSGTFTEARVPSRAW